MTFSIGSLVQTDVNQQAGVLNGEWKERLKMLNSNKSKIVSWNQKARAGRSCNIGIIEMFAIVLDEVTSLSDHFLLYDLYFVYLLVIIGSTFTAGK